MVDWMRPDSMKYSSRPMSPCLQISSDGMNVVRVSTWHSCAVKAASQPKKSETLRSTRILMCLSTSRRKDRGI